MHLTKSLISLAVGTAIVIFSGQDTMAQQAVLPVPKTSPTREEINPAPIQDRPAASSVQIDSSRATSAGPCPLADSEVRATFTQVRFIGAGGATLAPELTALLAGIAPPAGDQPVKVVCDLRDEAQTRLRTAHYVASIQVPQQRIDQGTLTLEVVVGRITEVRIRGSAGPYEKLLTSRINALRAIDPLNEEDAKRILLLANDVPGLQVELNLSPVGTRPGDLIGELTINYRPYSIAANVQNYNSKFLGREAIFLRGEFYGLTGLGDLTSLALVATADFREQRIAQARHSMLVNNAGDTVSVSGTLAESRPDLKSLDLRTVSLVGALEYAHPILRTVASRLTASGGLEYAQQRTKVYSQGNSSALTRDRIAAIFARLVGNARKVRLDGSLSAGVSGQLEVRKGLDILGATKAKTITPSGYGPSRFEGSSTATIVRGDADGFIGVGPIFELGASVRGQWANRPLLNYDEFSIGNLTIGRGYDPGANSGDRAIGFTVEPRANVPLGPDARAQIYGFYDGIKLWNLDTGSTEARRYLASVGGGVRFIYEWARLDLTYTHPLDPPLLAGTNIRPPKDRVLASLTIQFSPHSR